MAKPKKQTREERLRKKRLAEKKRYENIKNNVELWAEKQEKNRKSYIRRKEQKKQLPINEMPPREQRLQRKRWRTNFKTYYLKKKQEKRTAALLEQNTPPQSPNILSDAELVRIQNHIQESPLHDQSINRELESPVPGPSRITRSNSEQSCRLFPNLEDNSFCRKSPVCSSPVSSAVRRIRYNKDKEINHLKQIILKMKRQNERFKKQIQRIMPAKIKEISPVLTDQNRRNSRMKQKEFDNSIEITYWQWETKEHTIQGTARKIRTTEKLKKREEPKKCIEKLESTLDQYLIHCGNIVAQQKAFKHLKEHLQEGCMKMHQIVWNLESPVIAVRKLSCIDPECLYKTICCNHMNHLGFYRFEEVPHTLPVTPLANSTTQLREIGESFWTMSNKTNKYQDISGTPNKTANKEGSNLSEIDKIRNCSHSKSKLGIHNTQGAIGKESTVMKKNETKGEGNDRADRFIESTGDAFDNISEITFSRDGNQHFSIDLENVNPYLLDSDDEDLNIF
ncbi:hypothetical protein HF086_005956 [Spodoptera exigua]|uniref:Uncharacterized protein n=1 Tax=Spodoptera exigua TaxID=7107 RepID=A0A922M7F8_SPOEX|nr:hypothetical protein HF086_005956 [Spodoptera exigua]